MFPNYAGRFDSDEEIANELVQAGINPIFLPKSYRKFQPEMRTIVIGSFMGWSFQRYWRYWVAKGPGIEVAAAEELHAEFGQEVRVDGHCMCPSPREQFKGLAVNLYHVDSQQGLNALAETIRSLTV